MSHFDDIYLKTLLEKSLENFMNELITHKVSKIDCNFIEFIITKSTKHILYLDTYYTYFNQIDLNIIKNTRNSYNQLLIDYYRNINVETIESNAVQHISSFLKTYQITSNIIDLFGDNSIIDEIQNENQHDPPHADDSIIILRNDTDTIKQDIIRIQKDIQYIKDDMDAKFDKIFIILSNLK